VGKVEVPLTRLSCYATVNASVPDGKSDPCSSNSCITSKRRLSRTLRSDTLELAPGEPGVRGDRGVRGDPNVPSSNSPTADDIQHVTSDNMVHDANKATMLLAVSDYYHSH